MLKWGFLKTHSLDLQPQRFCVSWPGWFPEICILANWMVLWSNDHLLTSIIRLSVDNSTPLSNKNVPRISFYKSIIRPQVLIFFPWLFESGAKFTTWFLLLRVTAFFPFFKKSNSAFLPPYVYTYVFFCLPICYVLWCCPASLSFCILSLFIKNLQDSGKQ